MCRLLGYAAPDPVSVIEALGEDQVRRFRRMARLHDDGWGTMWLDTAASAPLQRVRTAESGHDSRLFAEAMHTPASRARVVHLRLATDDMNIEVRNTHPFVNGRIGMAHNGSIVPTTALREMLGEAAAGQIEGDTDSERYLALLRQHLDASADVPTALAETVRQVRAAYPVASLNAMVLTPEVLSVVRSSQDSPVPWDDFVASGLAEHELPLNHSDAYFHMSYRALPRGGWAFTSAGLEVGGWSELPENTIASVALDSLELSLTSVAPSERGGQATA